MSARRAAALTASSLALAALLGACADTPLVVAPGAGAPTSSAAPSAAPSTPAPAPAPPPPPATAGPATSPEASTTPDGRVVDLSDGAATTLTVSPVDQRAVVTVVGGGAAAAVQVNPDTAAVATRSAVTGSPRAAVPATDRSGLVLADPSAGLSAIALPSGSSTDAPQGAPAGVQALGVDPSGNLLVAATGVVGDARREAAGVVANGTLSLLRDNRVAAQVGGLGRPVALAVAGERAAVLDSERNVVHLIDLSTMREQSTLPAGDGPTGLTIDRHGRLLVTDTRAGVLRRYDLAQGGAPTPLAPIQLGASSAPYGTAYDATTDQLWVTLTGTNRLVAIDLSSADAPRTVLDLATITQPDLVALGQGRVYVASPRTGQLQITLA
ncbi:YncE family protein [Actinomycetospora sp. CA-084318]|uniref:YncE family protein n=1 Tax=Actinomycetospora sp. CA-084318 TaxID=3239892 RepID=UPI003D96A749